MRIPNKDIRIRVAFGFAHAGMTTARLSIFTQCLSPIFCFALDRIPAPCLGLELPMIFIFVRLPNFYRPLHPGFRCTPVQHFAILLVTYAAELLEGVFVKSTTDFLDFSLVALNEFSLPVLSTAQTMDTGGGTLNDNFDHAVSMSVAHSDEFNTVVTYML